MIVRKVSPGFATINLYTGVNGTYIALTAYVNGNVKCLPTNPNVPCLVEVIVQQKHMWVEAESLTDPDTPNLPFQFCMEEEQVVAA